MNHDETDPMWQSGEPTPLGSKAKNYSPVTSWVIFSDQPPQTIEKDEETGEIIPIEVPTYMFQASDLPQGTETY
jgi:hypothetical protein